MVCVVVWLLLRKRFLWCMLCPVVVKVFLVVLYVFALF